MGGNRNRTANSWVGIHPSQALSFALLNGLLWAKHPLVQAVFLHLFIECLARNAERFVDRSKRSAMGGYGTGDNGLLEVCHLFRQPTAVGAGEILLAWRNLQAKHQTVGGVAELADIARPVSLPHNRKNIGGHLQIITPIARRGFPDEVQEQERNVGTPLLQRRYNSSA